MRLENKYLAVKSLNDEKNYPVLALCDILKLTWNEIFLHWLPQSEFEFDETRHDFEHHYQRDHGWYFGGKLQIDICIPIRQREEEIRKSQLRASR